MRTTKYVPHVCPACHGDKYYGILVASDQKPPRCPNCNRVVIPARKSA